MSEEQNKFTFEGSITEIYDKDSCRIAKVYCPSAIIEINLDKCGELLLGDKVKISCIVRQESVEHIIEE